MYEKIFIIQISEKPDICVVSSPNASILYASDVMKLKHFPTTNFIVLPIQTKE